jgi:hypothetical protein
MLRGNEIMSESREYTRKEVKDQFLQHVRRLINYWETVDKEMSSIKKLEGLAFSILATIDGCGVGLPGFILSPNPHEDDKQYCIDEGENYYSEAKDETSDIGGGLHELL